MAKRPFFPRQKPFTPPPVCRCPDKLANRLRKNIRNILGPHVSGSLILPPELRWAYVCPRCGAVISWADDARTKATIDFFRPLGMAPIYGDKERGDES